MKALRFDAPIPTYLLTRVAGGISARLYVGPHACTRYTDVPEPALPGDRWVRVRTRLGGICGSDLAVITLKASPSVSPYTSFPCVLGHENVGDVIEVGRAVEGFKPGDRVTANPLLCCAPRGVEPPCAECMAGRCERCAHFTDGDVPPGLGIGITRGLGGSWGEQFVAHEHQLLKLSESLSDAQGLLIEPLACSVQAVRANLPAAGEQVLVVGAGSIGLMTVAALTALAPECRTTVLARHRFQGEYARRLGASRVIGPGPDSLRQLAEAADARLLQPILGKPIAVGGFNWTFVCVAGTSGFDDAMRLTRAGGTVVVMGNAVHLEGLDWTPLWFKELTLRGSVAYGTVPHSGPGASAFEEAARLIADGRAPVEPLLTHTFPLAEYSRALATALGKRDAQSVKVAFSF